MMWERLGTAPALECNQPMYRTLFHLVTSQKYKTYISNNISRMTVSRSTDS